MFSSQSVITNIQRQLILNRKTIIKMGIAAILVGLGIVFGVRWIGSGKPMTVKTILALLAVSLCLELVYGIRYAVKQMIEAGEEIYVSDCFILSLDHFGKVFVKNIIFLIGILVIGWLMNLVFGKTKYDGVAESLISLYLSLKFILIDYCMMDDAGISIVDAITKSFSLMTFKMMEEYIKIFLEFWKEWCPALICGSIIGIMMPASFIFTLFGGFDSSGVLGALGFLGIFVCGTAALVELYFILFRLLPLQVVLSTCFYIELKAKSGEKPEEKTEEVIPTDIIGET